MNHEAFVYLWFDAKNRMFYLGYHKGHPDDDYTHSSTIMESFTKKTIPTYMRRRILATGTHQEMLDLENKLLENRKEKCWDKYYNVNVAFPPPPMYGEDHPMWKGGIWSDPEKINEYYRNYYAKNVEKKRKYAREYRREYRKKNPEKMREYDRQRRAIDADKRREYRVKNAEKLREYDRKYREKNRDTIREKNRERKREYRAKNRDKLREYYRQYYARKKAEKAL